MNKKLTAFQWALLTGMIVGLIITLVGTTTGTLGFTKMW